MGSSQRIEINKGNTKEEETEKKNRDGAPKAYASFWRSLYSRFPPFYRLRMLKGKKGRERSMAKVRNVISTRCSEVFRWLLERARRIDINE